MNQTAVSILVASNVLLAAAVTFQAFKTQPPLAPAAVIEPPPPPSLDLTPLLKPVETLDQSLGQFSSTLQRFNTTIVQYDFLQKEIERLGRLDQALAVRVNIEAAKPESEQTEESTQALDQLRQLHAQVQKETERRRQTMIQLIGGLEKELASTTLNEAEVKQAIREIPVPSEEPAAAPASPE